ncbi:hypothetical protein CLV24_12268 [Pontibacter ummariensis]|uniref:Lipopolysaccharide assembly protein A domain-containing protein n=1 Tax=Pontibacter ummariensis TaxID=1610492 RepID=A0A239JLF7_9BACT|nr:hypothetical protein [Pontibacter ummariensis]PRY07878.1 hypothetical protein CLV24_12268 [Pontibacter ummariensis]SNT06660.1 hypothetical protein SAMN06296052_12268 [Pontibacter ummariensis]
MRALKAILDLLVLAYVVFTVLLLTSVLNENTIFNISTENQVLDLYKIIAAVGGVLMLARLLVSRVHVAGLKHEQHMAQLKINELKADLYEKRQEFRSNNYQRAQVEEKAEVSK